MGVIVLDCVNHKITNPLVISLAPRQETSYAYLVGKIKKNTAQFVSIFPRYFLFIFPIITYQNVKHRREYRTNNNNYRGQILLVDINKSKQKIF